MKGKRLSIRLRLQRIVLIISATALIITSVLGVVIMMGIRSRTEDAMSDQMRNNLLSIVNDKADLAEAQLVRYEQYAESFAGFITSIYNHPESFNRWEIWDRIPENYPEGKRYPTPARRSEDTVVADFADEIALTDNVAWLLYPVMESGDGDISAVYWGNENGILIGFEPYMAPPDMIYDYWQVPWYFMAKEEDGTVFTDIYLDGTGRGLTISCAAPYYNEKGEFHGVFGVDVLIDELYREVVSLDLGEGAYAFLVDNSGNVVSPDGEARPLEESESLDSETAEKLLAADGEVFLHDGVYYVSSKINTTGWTFCLHIPQSLAMASVRSIDNSIRTAIVIYVIIFAAILLIVALIINRFSISLTRPVLALEEDVRKMSGGNLGHKATIMSNDEIGDLAKSFNDMSASLRDYIETEKRLTAEHEKIEAELSVAAKIQADLLPTNFPKGQAYDIYASLSTAKEVGGDFYDFFMVNEKHLGLVMADVSGKGVPAAMFMAITKTLISIHAMNGVSPAELLGRVNNILCRNNDQNLFVTVWVADLNLETGELIYADAGHEDPILRIDGEYAIRKTEHCPPLGTMEDNEYREERVVLCPGDRLFLYTDGATDARNEDKKRFGVLKLLKEVGNAGELPPKELVQQIEKAIDEYVGSGDPFDDITLMCVEYNGGK